MSLESVLAQAELIHAPERADVRGVPAPAIPSPTLLESAFPFRELSLVAQADQRATDAAYAAHRWWARRPPGVMRGILLAAAASPSSLEKYWTLFASNEHVLRGVRVHDPFVGGGSTLVEAARLGAVPSGTDVDPLAVSIVRHELERPSREHVEAAAKELMAFLELGASELFPAVEDGWEPLHYFYLHMVTCPQCRRQSPLYRNLIIARDSKRVGAVVRRERIVAFCPDCFDVHRLVRSDQKRLHCCRTYDLESGTFSSHRFTCPHCGHRATHKDLATGVAPRKLVAVEETNPKSRRRIRKPIQRDREALSAAHQRVVEGRHELALPTRDLNRDRKDARPLIFGITNPAQLFSDRQLLVFGRAFRWLRAYQGDPSVARAITLAVSNALTTNNKLCGYATEYGRLAPLFSVRSYSLPALSVELNPFHKTAGRGTLTRAFERVVSSTSEEVRRYTWSPKKRRVEAFTAQYSFTCTGSLVECRSATEPVIHADGIDACVFDPPYYDYIAYSELSEFYRAWLVQDLVGTPLLPSGEDPVRKFGEQLGAAISRALERLAPGRPVAFTYHSASKDAWTAIGVALDKAKLIVTALWPVRNDSHMGHHTHAGNCEWDLVVVCRRRSECEPTSAAWSVPSWRHAVRPLKISKVDAVNLGLAIAMAERRTGAPRATNIR